jgi:conjugative relaxase-like TrwC/TraI family protein
MISLGAIASASGAATYYTKDNYYVEGEPSADGQWFGAGADKLGLHGGVENGAFEAVLAGQLPGGAEIKTPSGQDRRAGVDLVFSAPKSLSILALVGGDQRLIDVLQESAKATLKWVEANLLEARQFDATSGTQYPVKTGTMVAALFTHDLSRNRDPQAHVHSVIANATLRNDGKWRAVHTDEIYNRLSTIGAVHNADLRARVEALGYQVVPAKNPAFGQFEIAGVSRAAIEAFSTRAAEIEAHIEATGREGTAAERDIAAVATREKKDPGRTRDDDRAEWSVRAAGIGFDPKPLIEAAMARAERGVTLWSSIMESARGIGARGMAMVEAMGLSPREIDPLVPERAGRLSPQQWAAAQAVAAGARHLSENEAAFSRLDLIRASLSLGGPVKVADVEARITTLAARGLLITDADGQMVTTEAAVALEKQVLALHAEGAGQSPPIVEKNPGYEVQKVARDLGLRRLSLKQEAAAALILSAKDRTVGVQGVAGAGKSTMLLPVARIAEAHGHKVIALAVGTEIAHRLGDDLKVPSASVAAFIGRHRALLDPAAPEHFRQRSLSELGGAVLMVDEASTLSSRQAADLLLIANAAKVARVAQIGDHRQHGAVAAGKPFVEAQKAGMQTAELTENVRAKSDIMRAVTVALDSGDLKAALNTLAPVTHEAPRHEVVARAVSAWACLPDDARNQTLLIGAGRRLTAELNAEAQSIRQFNREITGRTRLHIIHERVRMSREEARTMGPYREGLLVEFRSELTRQGIAKGTMARIVGIERDKVRLDAGGQSLTFHPAKLARNLSEDAVSLYAERQVRLHVGDKIRFTANDHDAGVRNSQQAVIEKLRGNDITLRLGEDHKLALKLDSATMRKVDLAYAINAYVVQGLTTTNGIVVMDSRDKMLASARNLHVAVTRIADTPALFVDSVKGIERAVGRNPALKTSALDVYREQSGYNQQIRDEAAARWRGIMNSEALRPENLRAYPDEHKGPQRTDVPEKTKERGL